MDLVIDHARQQELSCCIQDLHFPARRQAGPDFLDSVALDQDVSIFGFAFIDEACVGDE